MLKCRLKVIFAQRNIRQIQFAKKIPITKGALSKIVNGLQIPSLETAIKIANLLFLKVEDIWYFEEE